MFLPAIVIASKRCKTIDTAIHNPSGRFGWKKYSSNTVSSSRNVNLYTLYNGISQEIRDKCACPISMPIEIHCNEEWCVQCSYKLINIYYVLLSTMSMGNAKKMQIKRELQFAMLCIRVAHKMAGNDSTEIPVTDCPSSCKQIKEFVD